MLDVLLGRELHNVSCGCDPVLWRDTFRNRRTGAGIRRRSPEGLKTVWFWKNAWRAKWKIGTDYSGLGKVQYILAEAELPILDSEYGEGVDLTILVPFDQAGAAEKKLIEGTNGRCRIEKLDEVYFGMDDGKIILL